VQAPPARQPRYSSQSVSSSPVKWSLLKRCTPTSSVASESFGRRMMSSRQGRGVDTGFERQVPLSRDDVAQLALRQQGRYAVDPGGGEVVDLVAEALGTPRDAGPLAGPGSVVNG